MKRSIPQWISRLKLPVLLILAIVLSSTVQAQVKISGKVTANNAGVAGISVVIKNTQYGTSTDASGNYSITATLQPGNYILEFTGVGFKTRENSLKISNDNSYTVDVTMANDALGLDEVVVTGTNVRTSKKQLGNSISTINASQLQNTGASNLSAILNGRVMGAQITQNSGDPAGGISIKLRGVGSIFGSSEPLYIVDGVIIDNSSANVLNLNADAQGARIQTGANRLVDINPNDIDRVEVINGAAAAAIYGSRASNGVVQIFTKRGKSGKAKVTLSTSFQVNSLRKKLEFNTTPFRFGIPGDARLSTVGDRLTTIANLTGQAGTGPAALGGRLIESKYPVTRYDYQDDLFKTSYGTDNHIAVSGGNEKSNYYISGSYLKNDGIIRNTNFQRYGLKFRGDININRWVKVSGGALYTNAKSKDLPNGNNFFSPISTMTIIDNVWNIKDRDANGNLLGVERVRMNPLSVIETYDLRSETNRSLADMKLTLTPIKGLNIDVTNGFDTYAQTGNTYQARVAYENVSADFFPDGYVSYARYNYFQWTSEIVGSYKFNINDDIQSTSSAGYSAQYIKTTYAAQEGRDILPIVRNISAAQNLFRVPVDTRTEQSVFGYFLQQTLGYKNKLFLTAAGRFDGSSAFGKNAQNIFYPKASISYSLSDESFWKDSKVSDWFNTLKLRASYGKAGNLTGIGAYDRFVTYSPVNYTGGGFAPRNQIGNVNISPEIKKEFEGGADMQFLKGRLGLQFSVFSQKITDLVLPFNISPSNGASSLVDNLGEMTNKGFELMLTGSPVNTKAVQWNISLLVNKTKNEITKLYKNAGFIGFDAGGTQGVLEGYPAGVYYINYYARNSDGSLLLRDVNGFKLPQVERGDASGKPARDANGQPTGTPLRKVIGDPNPDYTATLVNEVSYKNFSLRIQIDRVAGFEIYNWDWITRNNVGNGKLAEKELKGELPRGWVAAIGGFIGPRIQEEHVQDGTFTKLREVALTYTLNKKLKFAESLKFSIVGRNLVSWDNYVGFDPEINSSGQSIVRGNDFGAFPIPKTFQLSVIANF